MSIFENLLNLLQDDSTVEAEVATVELAKKVEEIRPIFDKKDAKSFDEKINLLDPQIRKSFNDTILFENAIFTSPQSTTITMEGFIDNVNFKENELIMLLEPDDEIPIIKCNFARKVYPGYTEPVKVKKSNRGRKKREKKKKNRKKQGLGTEFNTQITFVVRPDDSVDDYADGVFIIPACKVYKFKVFRTGKIQLPGVSPESIDEVIHCAHKIVKMLQYTDCDGVKNAKLLNINHVMKNYKFKVKTRQSQNLDLLYLKGVFLEEMTRANPTAPPHPPVFDVKYTRQETKLAVKFSTPTSRKGDKKLKINVFPSGKINILGAFADADTIAVYNYITWVFQTSELLDCYIDVQDNIMSSDIDEADIAKCAEYL